jgi:hypothetical protein
VQRTRFLSQNKNPDPEQARFTSFYSAALWRHAKVDINPDSAIVPGKLGFTHHHEVHEAHKEKDLTYFVSIFV